MDHLHTAFMAFALVLQHGSAWHKTEDQVLCLAIAKQHFKENRELASLKLQLEFKACAPLQIYTYKSFHRNHMEDLVYST